MHYCYHITTMSDTVPGGGIAGIVIAGILLIVYLVIRSSIFVVWQSKGVSHGDAALDPPAHSQPANFEGFYQVFSCSWLSPRARLGARPGRACLSRIAEVVSLLSLPHVPPAADSSASRVASGTVCHQPLSWSDGGVFTAYCSPESIFWCVTDVRGRLPVISSCGVTL